MKSTDFNHHYLQPPTTHRLPEIWDTIRVSLRVLETIKVPNKFFIGVIPFVPFLSRSVGVSRYLSLGNGSKISGLTKVNSLKGL